MPLGLRLGWLFIFQIDSIEYNVLTPCEYRKRFVYYKHQNSKTNKTMTTGEQVKKFLYTLYPDYTPKRWDDNWVWHFNFDKPTQLSIRVEEIGTVDKLVNALNVSGIDPMFVDINKTWDKLQITICNYEKDSELDFSTDY